MSCSMSALLQMAHPRFEVPRHFQIGVRNRDQDREARVHHVLLRNVACNFDCDLGATDLAQVLGAPGRI